MLTTELNALQIRDAPISVDNAVLLARCFVPDRRELVLALDALWNEHTQINAPTILRNLQEAIAICGLDPWMNILADVDWVTDNDHLQLARRTPSRASAEHAINITSFVVYACAFAVSIILVILHVKQIKTLQTHEWDVVSYSLTFVVAVFALMQIIFYTSPPPQDSKKPENATGLAAMVLKSVSGTYNGKTAESILKLSSPIKIKGQAKNSYKLELAISLRILVELPIGRYADAFANSWSGELADSSSDPAERVYSSLRSVLGLFHVTVATESEDTLAIRVAHRLNKLLAPPLLMSVNRILGFKTVTQQST